MVKNNSKMIVFMLIFCYLLSFSIEEKHKGTDSLTKIEFDHNKGSAEYEVEEAKKTQKFLLEFTEGKTINFYMKIEVTVEGDFSTPVLCFSPTDENCDNDREQIVKNPNSKSVVMWLKREQFSGQEQLSLYVKVICEEQGVDYKLKFESNQAVQYGPNFAYSYYVGNYNKEMLFEIFGNGETGTLMIGAQGSKVIDIRLENGIVLPFDNGVVGTFSINEESHKSLGTFTVKGNTEDYITLSVHLINENGTEILEPNGPEITGFLENVNIEEDCYKISSFTKLYQNANKFYLTGKFYSMQALIYFKDENGKNIDSSMELINNGEVSKVIKLDDKVGEICLNFQVSKLKEYSNLFYTLSLSEPITIKSIYNYYPPQIPGKIYRRFLPKGKIAFYSPMALDKSAKKYNYNIYSVKGYSKMGITKCKDYPYCLYENLNGLEIPKNTNQMSIWTTDTDLSSTIGKEEKNVIVVQCLDDDNDNNGYCLFETSVINKGDKISLIPEEKFSYYILKEEKGSFKIKAGNNAKRVTIDIMIFSGDISFDLKGDLENVNYYKYYLSNKILFQLDLTRTNFYEFEIEFLGALNSFFTIKFEYNTINVNQLEEIIPSGENYLVQIDPTIPGRKKTIHLQNLRYKKQKPFLANFFALNCEFSVTRGKGIEFYDGYAQEILDADSKEYKSETYNYEIKIEEPDLSNYNHKMCMLYVDGIESNEDEDNKKEIIVGENVNQQIIFKENYKKVRFLYPQADSEKDLSIYANIIDPAYYKINVYLNNHNEPLTTYTVTRTRIFYISKNDISNICKKDQLCSVIVEVEVTANLIKTDPMIEITIRQIKNIPSYIQKSRSKMDFTCGDNFYYLYTDIGKNEIGDVSIDFLRDFGDIWGKIVRKDLTTAEEEANWRGIYRMPSEDWEDSLEYNRYIKKLLIRAEDTQDCIEGCYLLMSIRVSQIGEYVEDSKFYPFSIIIRITSSNRAYTDIPKVVIQVDEYIVGNVDISNSERIYEFYEVWLPHDADRVDFDWQSGVAGLYINLGGYRPTTKNADFQLLPPGEDSVLFLTKKQILDKCKSKNISPPYKDSIEDLNLVIGVWTDKTDGIDTEIYSLRIHEVLENDENKLDIIEVKADRKIFCKPHFITENQYRCLFMITYDDDDTILYTPFYGHATSVDASSMTYMYGNLIDRNYYDELKYSELSRNIPTYETAKYNSKEDGVDYIYIKNLDPKKYLFINVIADSDKDIFLLSSMPLYNFISTGTFEFYPIPGCEQLLSVTRENLRLIFATDKSILMNIVTLAGEAEIWWNNDPNNIYSLRGRGDRLSLSSGKSAEQLILHQRKIEYNNIKTMEDPGFLFYITYYMKEDQNFDEVVYGKSLEFGYRETDLPVILYCKIGDYNSDINVAVTFKDLKTDTSGDYISPPLDVRASLLKENAIYKAKKDPELQPSIDRLVLGSYDTAIKTAQVMLSKEIISNYNLKLTDNPTIYLLIEKNKKYSDKIYDKFSIEVQFSKANEGIIPTEKVYYYGRIGDESRMTYYKLRIDKKKPFMRIQTAFNNDNIEFSVSDTISAGKNMSFISTVKERGKTFITLTTKDLKTEYLTLVFYKKNTKAVKSLYNYVFKYINAKSVEEYVDYKMTDNNETIIYKQSNNTENPEESIIECTFHKIDVKSPNISITYFLKIVDANSYISGETYNTIAVTESPYYTVYERNPKDNKNLITLTAKGDFKKWTILQVIAQIQQETILEYVTYKGIYVYREPDKKDTDDKSDDKESDNKEEKSDGVSPVAFFVVGGILLVLVLGLIAAIIIFKIKNQELVEQVKHVSFQKTNSANFNNNNNNNSNSNVDPNNLIGNPESN